MTRKKAMRKKTPKKAIRRGSMKWKSTRRKAKGAKSMTKQSAMVNREAYWAAFRDLQKKVDTAWSKLRSDVARKANPQTLIKDKNHLLLLLGECNYMARECMRLATKSRRR